jgi:isopentenyl-diphosphate delta-isomerase
MTVPSDKCITLIDENDVEIGACDKLSAHQDGRLHRAFSVFVFNSKGQWLLQRRAEGKYHSGGLWTNSCCSHPAPGVDIGQAAQNTLRYEMGIDCDLKKAFFFTYRAELDHNLTEYELDHVFIGHCDDTPTPNPEEASEWRWADTEQIAAELKANPESFSYWFRECFEGVRDQESGVRSQGS